MVSAKNDGEGSKRGNGFGNGGKGNGKGNGNVLEEGASRGGGEGGQNGGSGGQNGGGGGGNQGNRQIPIIINPPIEPPVVITTTLEPPIVISNPSSSSFTPQVTLSVSSSTPSIVTPTTLPAVSTAPVLTSSSSLTIFEPSPSIFIPTTSIVTTSTFTSIIPAHSTPGYKAPDYTLPSDSSASNMTDIASSTASPMNTALVLGLIGGVIVLAALGFLLLKRKRPLVDIQSDAKMEQGYGSPDTIQFAQDMTKMYPEPMPPSSTFDSNPSDPPSLSLLAHTGDTLDLRLSEIPLTGSVLDIQTANIMSPGVDTTSAIQTSTIMPSAIQTANSMPTGIPTAKNLPPGIFPVQPPTPQAIGVDTLVIGAIAKMSLTGTLVDTQSNCSLSTANDSEYDLESVQESPLEPQRTYPVKKPSNLRYAYKPDDQENDV